MGVDVSVGRSVAGWTVGTFNGVDGVRVRFWFGSFMG